MSRQEEVEASIKWIMSAGMTGGAITPNMRDLCRTLAAEVEARDAVITKLLAMLRDSADSECYCEDDDYYPIEVCERHELYHRACEIAGRTE